VTRKVAPEEKKKVQVASQEGGSGERRRGQTIKKKICQGRFSASFAGEKKTQFTREKRGKGPGHLLHADLRKGEYQSQGPNA